MVLCDFVFVADLASLANLAGGALKLSFDDASRFTANFSMGPVVGVFAFEKGLFDLDVTCVMDGVL